MDATRIYAYPTKNTYENENRYINDFSPLYLCNRIAGGKNPGGLIGLIEMAKSIKTRNLD